MRWCVWLPADHREDAVWVLLSSREGCSSNTAVRIHYKRLMRSRVKPSKILVELWPKRNVFGGAHVQSRGSREEIGTGLCRVHVVALWLQTVFARIEGRVGWHAEIGSGALGCDCGPGVVDNIWAIATQHTIFLNIHFSHTFSLLDSFPHCTVCLRRPS